MLLENHMRYFAQLPTIRNLPQTESLCYLCCRGLGRISSNLSLWGSEEMLKLHLRTESTFVLPDHTVSCWHLNLRILGFTSVIRW